MIINMKIILPFEIKPKIETECWNYYKMSIIQTLPNYTNWLAAHMGVCVDTVDEQVYFGTEGEPYPLEYFSDILDIEELDMCTIYPDSLVERVKERINNGWYYVVFVSDETEYSHEVFLYGYDDEEKVFYSVCLNEHGHFEPRLVTYNWLKAGYQNILHFFMNNPEAYYSRRKFGYLVFCLRPCFKYLSKNYAAEYFVKLNNELYGKRADIFFSRRNTEYRASKSYYTGIACLLKVKDQITLLRDNGHDMENTTRVGNIQKSLFKLLEHRSMMVEAMEWFETLWNITEPSLLHSHKCYASCLDKMKMTCMLFLKYLNYLKKSEKNDSILDSIIMGLDAQYRSEKEYLGTYVAGIESWYYRHVLPRKLEMVTQI